MTALDDSNAAPGAWPNAVFGNVTVAGSLTTSGNEVVAGNQTISGTLDVTGNETVGGALTVVGGETIGGSLSVHGAATSVPAAVFTAAQTLTGASTGTLTNSPHSGDPFTFLEISINGTLGAIPVFATT